MNTEDSNIDNFIQEYVFGINKLKNDLIDEINNDSNNICEKTIILRDQIYELKKSFSYTDFEKYFFHKIKEDWYLSAYSAISDLIEIKEALKDITTTARKNTWRYTDKIIFTQFIILTDDLRRTEEHFDDIFLTFVKNLFSLDNEKAIKSYFEHSKHAKINYLKRRIHEMNEELKQLNEETLDLETALGT